MPPTYVPSASPPGRFLDRLAALQISSTAGSRTWRARPRAAACRMRRALRRYAVVPGDAHQLDEAGHAELAHDLVLERLRDRLEGEDVLHHAGGARQPGRQRGQIPACPHALDDVVAQALPARDHGVGDPLVGLAHRARRDQDRHLSDVPGQRRAEAEKLADVAHALGERRVVHPAAKGPRMAPRLRDLVLDLLPSSLVIGFKRNQSRLHVPRS